MTMKFIIVALLSMFASTMFAAHSIPSDTIKKVAHHPKNKAKKKTVSKNTTSTGSHTAQNNETSAHQHPNPLPIAPSYKDGQQAMLDFIKANVVVPQEVKKSGITIVVNVAFTVGIDGKLKDIKVIKLVGMGCDEEALRVVKLMPEWNPGKVGRVVTEMPFAIGIEFKN